MSFAGIATAFVTILALGLDVFKDYWLKPDSQLVQIYTKWGNNIDPSKVLPEYPRPQFQRDSYMNLNGLWRFSVSNSTHFPEEYLFEILVPFLVESPLSKVHTRFKPGTYLYYNKKFDFSGIENKGRIILHFGAVDQICDVFIDKKKVGTHKGGYGAFKFDITEYISDIKNVEIDIRVLDLYDKDGEAYGKQSTNRGNIWYIQTSGIWQTVWIESVPQAYINNVKIDINYDKGTVLFTPDIFDNIESNNTGTIEILDKDSKPIVQGTLNKGKTTELQMPQSFESWSPENPYLYKIKYTYSQDSVSSYFGMRKFSISNDSQNLPRLYLNNKPYFHNGLLDQGYWSDGFYTPPSDEAMVYDIQAMKDLGFNMLRKHIKIEPMRWYYHCDRLGMLVWQDAVSGGEQPYNPFVIQLSPNIGVTIPDNDYAAFGRDSAESRNTYYRELKEMIEQLYNVVSISTWVPFNEGWGQFDANKAVDFIKGLDVSRHIDHASGWHDMGGGDFKSYHIYFKPVTIGEPEDNRTVVLSEFGGYSLPIEGHMGSNHLFGYVMYKDKGEFNQAIKKLYEDEIIPAMKKGLSATVYTQVSDVEDEVNGLLTYDRKVLKVDEKMMKEINDKLKY